MTVLRWERITKKFPGYASPSPASYVLAQDSAACFRSSDRPRRRSFFSRIATVWAILALRRIDDRVRVGGRGFAVRRVRCADRCISPRLGSRELQGGRLGPAR